MGNFVGAISYTSEVTGEIYTCVAQVTGNSRTYCRHRRLFEGDILAQASSVPKTVFYFEGDGFCGFV